MKYILAACLIIVLVAGCVGSPGNLEYVKAHAAETYAIQGFQIVGYEGYQWSSWGYNDYGGAKVWYITKKPNSEIRYNSYLWRWGNEIHVYSIRAIDAIGPH